MVAGSVYVRVLFKFGVEVRCLLKAAIGSYYCVCDSRMKVKGFIFKRQRRGGGEPHRSYAFIKIHGHTLGKQPSPVSNTLSLQAPEPKFNLQNTGFKMLDMFVTSELEKWRQAEPWDWLARQLSLCSMSQASEGLSQNEQSKQTDK